MAETNLAISDILKRCLRKKCPSCGTGPLFSTYITPHRHCTVCHADFTGLRADDGPAWLTILLTGHILAPVIVMLAQQQALSDIQMICVILTLALFTGGLTLPYAKAVFMGLIWWQKTRSIS